jgi:pyruvate dehydrogenase E2 component (dihydrolipoamide acetyltransferase)
VGQFAPRAVAHGEEIVIRSMMTMTLSADHRIVDGAVTARFLKEVKGLLEKRAG